MTSNHPSVCPHPWLVISMLLGLVLAAFLAGCAAPAPTVYESPAAAPGTNKLQTALALAQARQAVLAETAVPPPVPACYAINRQRQVVPVDCWYNNLRHTWVLDIQNPHPLSGIKKPTIQASVNLFTWYTATNILHYLGSTNTNFSVVLSITNKPIEFYRVKWS